MNEIKISPLTYEIIEETEAVSAVSMKYSMKKEAILDTVTMVEQLKVIGMFYKVENPEELATKTPQELLEMEKEMLDMNKTENTYNPKAYILSVETYERAEEASAASIKYMMENEAIMDSMTMIEQLKISGMFYKVENPEELTTKTPQELLEMDFSEMCRR